MLISLQKSGPPKWKFSDSGKKMKNRTQDDGIIRFPQANFEDTRKLQGARFKIWGQQQ